MRKPQADYLSGGERIRGNGNNIDAAPTCGEILSRTSNLRGEYKDHSQLYVDSTPHFWMLQESLSSPGGQPSGSRASQIRETAP